MVSQSLQLYECLKLRRGFVGFTGSVDEADEASFYTESKAERQGCRSLPSSVHDLLPKARSSGKKATL